MSRMHIDAIALLKNRPTPPDSLDAKGVEGFRCCLRMYNAEIEKQIANRDTDVVEVVRCKDCKHCLTDDYTMYCERATGLDQILPDDFCSYGERRTN